MTESADEAFALGEWLSWSPESLPPSRWNQHLPLVAWLFAHLNPRLSVELGTGAGASFRAICQVADRFGRGGRAVGIDPWRTDPSALWRDDPVYEGLKDYCVTRHADIATLLRMELQEAVGEFEDGSIDFLHIARPDQPAGSTPFDPALWMPKMRAGGVVVVSAGDEEGLDEALGKVWRQIAEWYPSVSVALSRPVGLAQVPTGSGAPLVESLHNAGAPAAALFRSLGERIEYRHLLGSEPVSGQSLRRHIAELATAHGETVRRMEAQHRADMSGLEQDLASVSERLLARSQEADRLQSEADYLLAQVAARAAAYEREMTELRAEQARHVAEVEHRYSLELGNLHARYAADTTGLNAEVERLRGEVEARDQQIRSMAHTLSWRVTRPLRIAQRLRLKLLRRAR